MGGERRDQDGWRLTLVDELIFDLLRRRCGREERRAGGSGGRVGLHLGADGDALEFQ